MQLFKTQEIDTKKIKELENTGIRVEKDIQEYFEKNIHSIIDAHFIATEFSVEKGRIDTLAIDDDLNPIIIEYKKGDVKTGLLQAMFYKSWLLRNRTYFRLVVKDWIVKNDMHFNHKRLSIDDLNNLVDNISFNNTCVVVVAESFDPWTKASTTHIPNTHLLRYTSFENMKYVQFEYENEVWEKRDRFKTKTKTIGIPLASDADYEIAEYVISSGGKNDTTNLYKFNKMSDNLKDIYSTILEYIEEFAPNFQIIKNKDYWVFKTNKKFADVVFYKSKISIQLFLNKIDIDKLEINVEDLSEKGHWGTLLNKINISHVDQISELATAIKMSIDNVHRHFG